MKTALGFVLTIFLMTSGRVYAQEALLSPPTRSDVMSALKYHSEVKAQVQRNLCTVFATLGAIEALYLRNNPQIENVDLSEEWLQYVVAVQSPSGGGNGSTVSSNLSYIKRYGIASEKALPYDGTLWSPGSSSLAHQRCGSLSGLSQKKCLMGHFNPILLQTPARDLQDPSHPLYNPEFFQGLQSAGAHLKSLSPYISAGQISGSQKVKSLLAQGRPVVVEFDIYYGAWNLTPGEKMGIERDGDAFINGIVNYPEKGSVDRDRSLTEKNRHALVLVGYDDDVEISYQKKMSDGSVKKFTRRGVYYFKNSWGRDKFGSRFQIGNSRIRGFGMMPQAYADDFGKFTAISLSEKAVIND